jgi:hydroxyethylthiazole kinase-like uncharacterized protein yjeF
MAPHPLQQPVRIQAHNGPWPLHDAAASRELETQALAAAAPGALMARAGRSVARLALALAPHARQVQVWCGPGNNGGDGLVAARHLWQAGLQVDVRLLADASRLPSDSLRALAEARAAGLTVHVAPGQPMRALSWAPPDLVIDALLGLGVSRPPQGDIAAAIAHINDQQAPVLAVDIPSGLHPDTGARLGETAVVAQHTLSLLTLKPGCFMHQGRDHAGQVWLDDLSVKGSEPSAWLGSAPEDLQRPHASHKGSHGDVAVVGGATGMEGAAWLAASAALAAGAGRVYCSPLGAHAALPAHRPELMWRDRWWLQPPQVLARSTVACGCGGGEAVRQALPALLSHAARLVLDADALNAVASDPMLQTLLLQRAGRGQGTLLTPHPLEAARLLACTAAEVQQDRLKAAGRLAAHFQATVLLKGSGTVVQAPGRRPTINPTGNAALATAGTGDVLAGWAAGLWAQQPRADARKVAAAAAWQHGAAADRHALRQPGRALRAADLVEALIGRD